MQQDRVRWDDRRFFIAVTSSLAVLMFLGFSRTFYLHTLFDVPAPSRFLQVHGAIMTGWIVLLIVQALLVVKRRVAWHRKLGYAGIIYAAFMIPIGCLATLGAAEREVRAHSAFVPSQLNVLGLELTQLLLFACLVGAAVWLRNYPPYHKRLMLIATLCILPNAIVRLVLLTNSELFTTNLSILSLWTLVVLGIVAVDSVRIRKLHPAFAWSASIAIVALYAAWFVSRTAIWDHFWMRTLG